MRGDIELREVRAADLPVFFEYQLDPEANRLAGLVARDRAAFDAHWAKILGDEATVIRSVLVAGKVAGFVTCFEREGLREVGYWIGPEHGGRGVATRALGEMLRQVEVRPLYASVEEGHVASVRVLEKCGFVPAPAGTRSSDPGDDGVRRLLFVLTARAGGGARSR